MVDRLEKQPKRKPPSLLKQADKLCGAIVRARGRCEECGALEGLQWAHGFSRSYRKIRHDLDNGFCLCARCHMRFTHNPIAWDDWLQRRWGPNLYREMRARALDGPKADLQLTVDLLTFEAHRLGIIP